MEDQSNQESPVQLTSCDTGGTTNDVSHSADDTGKMGRCSWGGDTRAAGELAEARLRCWTLMFIWLHVWKKS